MPALLTYESFTETLSPGCQKIVAKAFHQVTTGSAA
jgi:hypothetical protein